MKNSFLQNPLFILSILLFLGPGLKISAQGDAFRLADYRNPDYIYRALDLGYNLSSNLSMNRGNTPWTGGYHSSHTGVNGTYTRYSNSAAYQGEWNASAALSGTLGGNRQNLDESQQGQSPYAALKSNTFSHGESLSLGGSSRFYSRDRFYLEVSPDAGFCLSSGSSGTKRYDSLDVLIFSEELNNRVLTGNLSLGIFAGKGRIEQVQDARMALYIFEDLHRLGCLEKMQTAEDVIALSRLITQLKKARFFDSRLRKIAEITAIDSLLQSGRLAGNPGASYFTSLNDNWDFSNNPARFAGSRIYAGFVPQLNYLDQYSSMNRVIPSVLMEDTKRKELLTGLAVRAGYANEKPLSLKWQRSVTLLAEAGFMAHSVHEIVNLNGSGDTKTLSGVLPAFRASASYGAGWYPNSRTWMTAKWWMESGYERQTGGESYFSDEVSTGWYAYTGPMVQAYYYLSEKLRLTFSYNSELRFSGTRLEFPDANGKENTHSSWFNQSLYGTLTYSIF